MNIQDYFAEWDPMGFIAEGASKDEYNLEAAEVAKEFNIKDSDEKLAAKVHDVFVALMEIDPEGFYEQCVQRAPKIRSILTAGQGNV